MTGRLDPADVRAIARAVVELLRDQPRADALLDARQVAERFAVDRSWVYANADRLGALRLGDGPRARLRFDPAAVAAALREPERAAPPKRRRATTRDNAASGAELLPIRGRAA